MADTVYGTISPPTKAVDLGDGTYAVAVSPRNLGILGATAYVIASNAPASTRAYGNLLKGLGCSVWVCDGVADNDTFQTALDAITRGQLIFTDGTYNWSDYEYLKSYISVKGNMGTRIKLDTDLKGIFGNVRYGDQDWRRLEADSSNWTNPSGTTVLSNETIAMIQGAGCLKSVVSAAPCVIRRAISPVWDLSKAALLSLWIRPQYGGDSVVTVTLYSGAAYISWTLVLGMPGKWQELFLPFHSYDGSSGTMDFASIDALTITTDRASTYYFDQIQPWAGFFQVSDMELNGILGDNTVGDDALISFTSAAFGTLENLVILHANDESVEMHGCRFMTLKNLILKSRYDPSAAGGGPALDLGPGEGTGVDQGMVRNRFCKIEDINIICAEQGGFSLGGDFNTVARLTVGNISSDMGSAIGMELRHTYSTGNVIRDSSFHNCMHCVLISESAYGNTFEDIIGQCRRGGYIFNLQGGPDNKLISCKGYGSSEGGSLGTGVYFANATSDRTSIVGAGEWKNLAIGINMATACDDCVIKGQTFNTCTTGIVIPSGAARTVVKDNKYISVTTPISDAGTDTQFDLDISSVSSLDLSAVPVDLPVFTAGGSYWLCGYTRLYTEASSGDAGVNIRIGRLQADGTFDDDYYDVAASSISKALGYSERLKSADLIAAAVATGETITVGTAGNKTGTGEVKVILHLARL